MRMVTPCGSLSSPAWETISHRLKWRERKNEMILFELKKRLSNYPGAHPGEEWKLETDLNKCTDKEKEAIKALGLTLDDFKGFNRGEVAHMLFGYRFTKS